MLEELMSNPYAWALLSVCTIGSMIFAVYTWIKGKERKEFSHFQVSHAIVRGGKKLNPAIKFTFNGIEFSNLTSTKVAIWNSGNKVINNTDIVSGRELTISTKGDAEILSVEIIAESETTNEFSLQDMNDNAQGIEFDYVDKQEGVVLQVLHTGGDDDIDVNCKIKGGRQPRSLNQRIKKSKFLYKYDPPKVAAVMCIIMSGYVSLFAFVVIFAWFNPALYQSLYAAEPVSDTFNNILGVACVCSAIVVDILSFKMTRNVFRLSVPTALRKHM